MLHEALRRPLRRLTAALLLGATLAAGHPASAQVPAQPDHYTVNGQSIPIELQQMFMLAGFTPGAYYVDDVGDFGPIGQPPIMNINGGAALGTGSGEPSAAYFAQVQPPGAGADPAMPQAPATSDAGGGADRATGSGLVGVRIFWVYSPSVFSGASGGASGYIHLCPGNVFYRSSEGSFSVGGEYDSQYGGNDGWAGGAHMASSAGSWGMQNAPNGPVLVLQNADGSTQSFAANAVAQGRWQIGQTRYATEQGRASCP